MKDLTLTEGCITSKVTQGTVPLQSGGPRSEVMHEFSKQTRAVAANGSSLSGGHCRKDHKFATSDAENGSGPLLVKDELIFLTL